MTWPRPFAQLADSSKCLFPSCLLEKGFLKNNKIVQEARMETIQHTVEPVLSFHSNRRLKLVFQDRLALNAGQKYCRMLQREHSAILSTFIKVRFVLKIVFLCLLLSGCLRQA